MAAMQIKLDDKTLFGNDAGEDEDESVLMSYFVDQPAFADFLDPGQRLWIANGRKGMGKSALLVRFAHQVRSTRAPGAIVVSVVPSQLMALKEPPQTDNHALLENYWKQVMCGAINMELARDIGFAWTDNQMALVESAEVAGFAGRNLVGALLSRLVGKLNVGGVLELAPTPRPAANAEQLLRRIEQEKSRPQRPIWFLLDNIDARFQNSAWEQSFIASFFSACRNLVNESSGIGVRATVRTDVWASLTSAEDMDKVEQYRTEITWSAAQQRTLLANRILAYIRRHAPESEIARSWNSRDHADALIDCAFVSRMKWGGASAPAEHVLRVLAGGRPRWIAQLCRMAGVNAARDQKERIGIHHVTQAMGEFGRRRLADLYKEHQHQFADMRRLVECFSGGPRRYSTEELQALIAQKYVERVGAQNIPAVDGVAYRDPLQIARLLYKCGFVNGNNVGKASLAVPEFVAYDARPDLLEVDTNLDDGMLWELQPAYRNSLNVK